MSCGMAIWEGGGEDGEPPLTTLNVTEQHRVVVDATGYLPDSMALSSFIVRESFCHG